MLDADGYIFDQEPQNSMITAAADLINLNVEPPSWDQFQPVIGAVLVGDEDQESYPTGELEWSSIDDVHHNPSLFSCWIQERAHQSNSSMAIGATIIDKGECDMFEGRDFHVDANPHVVIGAI